MRTQHKISKLLFRKIEFKSNQIVHVEFFYIYFQTQLDTINKLINFGSTCLTHM
jgi:hypothetical protein